MANEKTTKISDLHPKDNKNVTIYPNTTSEAIGDKVDTLDSSDKVPTSNAVKKNDDRIENKVNNNSDKLLTKLDKDTFDSFYADEFTPLDAKTENMNKVIPTDLKIVTDTDGTKKFALFHDSEQITGQVDNIKLGDGIEYDEDTKTLKSIYHTFDTNFFILDENNVKLSNLLYFNINLRLKRNSSDKGYILFSTTNHEIRIGSSNYYESILDSDKLYVEYYDSKCEYRYNGIKYTPKGKSTFTYKYQEKDGILALLSDVWYQYRHTITITAKINDDDVSFCFTTGSSKNTSVDSLQDIFTLFASTKLSGNGFAVGTSGLSYLFNRIDIGTSVTDSYLFGKKGTETTSLAISSLTSITIEDDVTQD